MDAKNLKFRSLILLFFTYSSFVNAQELDTYIDYINVELRNLTDTIYRPLSLESVRKGVLIKDPLTAGYDIVMKDGLGYKKAPRKERLRKKDLENLFFKISPEAFSFTEKYLVKIKTKKEIEKHLYVISYYDYIIDLDRESVSDTIRVSRNYFTKTMLFNTVFDWCCFEVWKADKLQLKIKNKFGFDRLEMNFSNLQSGTYLLKVKTFSELFEYHLVIED